MTNKWTKTKLGNVCTLIKGVTYKSEDYADKNSGIVFLTLKSIAKGGGFNFDGIKYFKGKTTLDQFVKSGDLIIANTDLTRAGEVIGAPLFVPKINEDKDKYVFSMDISKLITDNNQLDKEYLYHYLSTEKVRNYMRSISNGSTVLHLKVKLVNDLELPLPPLALQQTIAFYLSKIERLIHITYQVIRKTDTFKQGLMQKYFSEINKDYKIVTLEDIGKFRRGPFGGALKKEIFEKQGYKVYEQKNAIYNDFSLGTYFINAKKYEEMKSFALESGDLIISCSGTLGKVAIVPKVFAKGIINQALLKITPSPEWDTRYVKYLLESSLIQNRFFQVAPGSAMKNMASMQTIKSTKIVKPILKDQQKIADILESLDNKNKVNQLLINKLSQLKKGLMDDIFSQKVDIKKL